MKPQTRVGLVRALNRFERAVRAHEMMGSIHPNDHAEVEEEYTRARKSLFLKLVNRNQATENPNA